MTAYDGMLNAVDGLPGRRAPAPHRPYFETCRPIFYPSTFAARTERLDVNKGSLCRFARFRYDVLPIVIVESI